MCSVLPNEWLFILKTKQTKSWQVVEICSSQKNKNNFSEKCDLSQFKRIQARLFQLLMFLQRPAILKTFFLSSSFAKKGTKLILPMEGISTN